MEPQRRRGLRVMYEGEGEDDRRALAAVNSGGQPPSRLTRLAAAMVAVLVISACVRAIVWMWWSQ